MKQAIDAMDDVARAVLDALCAGANGRGDVELTFEVAGRLAARGIDWRSLERAVEWLGANGMLRRKDERLYTVTPAAIAATKGNAVHLRRSTAGRFRS